MSEEKTFLDEEGFIVTTARAVLMGTTYAVSGITAVRLQPVSTQSGFLVLAGGLTALTGVTGVMLFVASLLSDAGTPLIGLLVGSVVFGGLGALLVRHETRKPNSFRVVITTASGQTTALRTMNKELAERVCSAITDAIVERG